MLSSRQAVSSRLLVKAQVMGESSGFYMGRYCDRGTWYVGGRRWSQSLVSAMGVHYITQHSGFTGQSSLRLIHIGHEISILDELVDESSRKNSSRIPDSRLV